MSPEQRQIQELERKVQTLTDFMMSFDSVATLAPNVQATIKRLAVAQKLSDLTDVENTTGATTGYVLKKTSTTWQPAPDIDT